MLPAVALLLAFAVGCGTRVVPKPPSAPLLSASLGQLVTSFNQNADAIRTLSLKLNLTAHEGKKKYTTITGFLLAQKPADLRIWGTYILVGRLFDMASNGSHFELSLPTLNQFIEGENNVIPEKASNALEKMRPQVILNALLINPVTATQRTALDPGGPDNDYEVLVLEHAADDMDRLVRRITFSRTDLLPHAQEIFDADGVHSTRATYDKYTVRQNIPIPTEITISRPIEGYSLRLRLIPANIVLNQPLTAPGTFQLAPPPGSTVIHLGPNGMPPSKPAKHRGLIG